MPQDNISTNTIYEQPLNEVIRVCLRLEQLFYQVDHQLDNPSALGTRNVISFIIHILHILDRPDFKTKLAKELSYHLNNLLRYDNTPKIDTDRLHKLVQQLEVLSSSLINSNGKIGHRLRDIELLNMLRLHLASPGGACSFDIPIYHHWLQQTHDVRRETIASWLADFDQVRMAITLLLDLVRKSARIEEKNAIHGFYQELLDPQSKIRMIRIFLPACTRAYPEISIGLHFLSVRFYSPNIVQQSAQYSENLAFKVAYCHAKHT